MIWQQKISNFIWAVHYKSVYEYISFGLAIENKQTNKTKQKKKQTNKTKQNKIWEIIGYVYILVKMTNTSFILCDLPLSLTVSLPTRLPWRTPHNYKSIEQQPRHIGFTLCCDSLWNLLPRFNLRICKICTIFWLIATLHQSVKVCFVYKWQVL